MPIIIFGDDSEIGELIHLDIDRGKLIEIHDECKHLSMTISKQLKTMEELQQNQYKDGAEIYQKLKCGCIALRNIIDLIESTKGIHVPK